MKCKKLTALLLTAAMTASVLAGCGGNAGGGSAETAKTEGQTVRKLSAV